MTDPTRPVPTSRKLELRAEALSHTQRAIDCLREMHARSASEIADEFSQWLQPLAELMTVKRELSLDRESAFRQPEVRT